jgi:hypothetical protein
MDDILRLVCELRALHGRRENGVPLDNAQHRRLDALERLFVATPEDDTPGPERRRWARLDVEIPAVVESRGLAHAVTIVKLGGGGLEIRPAIDVRRGEPAIVRVAEGLPREVRLQARAVWQNPAAIGLQFFGVPR